MADYCTVLDVRERVPDITTGVANAELVNCIEQAMAIVDDLLRQHATVPLTGTIPTSVKHGTADVAGGIFRSRRTGDGMMPALYDQGIKRIENYIKTTYKSGAFTR